jgi:hypothetical protein
MDAATSPIMFRGVACRYCGKPIRLSASLLKRATADDANEQGGLASKVFSARCRRYHNEGVFTLADIQGFPDERRSVRHKTASRVVSEQIGE